MRSDLDAVAGILSDRRAPRISDVGFTLNQGSLLGTPRSTNSAHGLADTQSWWPCGLAERAGGRVGWPSGLAARRAG